MLLLNLWNYAAPGDCVLIALGVLLFGFALAWGLRNDLHSWRTAILYYGWIVFGICSWVIPPMLFQVFLLTGLWLMSLMRPWNSVRWLQWSFLLSILAWGSGAYFIYQIREHSYASLRAEYPLISLSERIPRPALSCPEDPLMAASKEAHLACLEEELKPYGNHLRAEYLEAVHTHTLDEFFAREGLGFERMMPMMWFNVDLLTREGPFAQAGSSWSNQEKGDLWDPRKAEEVSALRALHTGSIVSFAFPQGFGFVKDRAHVAGFASHRFRELSRSPEPWKIVHIELVSLLLHDPPAVYQSDELPRMDREKKVPTRPMDPFESAALARIKKGEDLIVSEVPKGLRMLGSIRNAKQCIQCHEGKRGDLLGAFAYSLIETK